MDDFEQQLRSGLVDLADRVEPSGQLRDRVLRTGRPGRHESHARRRTWSITVAVALVAATAFVGGRLWTTSDSTDARVATNSASEAGPPNLRIVIGKEIVEQSPDGSRRVLAQLPEVPKAAVSVGDEVLSFRVGALDRVELSDASVDTLAVPYCQNAGVRCGDLLKTPDGTAVVYVYDTVGAFPEGSVPETTEYRASTVSHIALYREGETRELATIPVGAYLISFSPDGSSLRLYPHINPKEAEVIDGSRREDLVPRRLLQLDVATGAVRLFDLEGQPGLILVSPDGSRLVTGSYSSSAGTTFRLYDLTAETSTPLWEKLQPQAPRSQSGQLSLTGALWSPDGGAIYFGLSGIVDQTAGVDDEVTGVWRLDADTGGLTRASPVTGQLGYLGGDGRWLLLREIEVKGSVASGASISPGNRAYWLDVVDGTVVPVTLPLDAIVVDWPPQREFGTMFIIS